MFLGINYSDVGISHTFLLSFFFFYFLFCLCVSLHTNMIHKNTLTYKFIFLIVERLEIRFNQMYQLNLYSYFLTVRFWT